VSRKIRQAFADFPNWKRSENAMRELRKKVTFAIFAETDDLDRVTAMVDELFSCWRRRIGFEVMTRSITKHAFKQRVRHWADKLDVKQSSGLACARCATNGHRVRPRPPEFQ
jgi:hypothetical protein